MVIACNTAHLLVPKLENRLGINFVSLIEHTAQEATRRGIQTLGILASPTTIRTGLYEHALRERGISAVLPSSAQLIVIEEAIRSILAGKPRHKYRSAVNAIEQDLRNSGADAVLLGCTELSVLLPKPNHERLDPLHIITSKLIGDAK